MVAACKAALGITKAEKVALFLLEQGGGSQLALAGHVGLSESFQNDMQLYKMPLHNKENRFVNDIILLDFDDPMRQLG